MKEAAKLPAEGYMAGEFRHGPIELAGPGLTALLFGSGRPDRSLAALGRDLQQSGAFVLDVDPGPGPTEPGLTIVTPSTSALGRLVCGAKLSQLLSVGLARARGLPPGEFRFGQKVTTAL